MCLGKSLPHVRVLKASRNMFKRFDVNPFRNIRVLYLDDNALEVLSTPSVLKFLETISLRRQKSNISGINFGAFAEASKIYLSGNKLPNFELPVAFYSLKYLELAGTQRNALPSDIAIKAPNLRVLNLCNNSLLEIESIQGLRNLERLYLVNNKLEKLRDLGNTIPTLTRLKVLDIRYVPKSLSLLMLKGETPAHFHSMRRSD